MTETDATVRVFMVEDHERLRALLRRHLERRAGYSVCGVASTVDGGLAGIEETAPDVVLVDTFLFQSSGIELVRQVQTRWPELPCLMLSGHAEANYVKQAFTAGARGYVLKDDPAELPQAIEAVHQGRTYVSLQLRPKRTDSS